MEPMDDVDDGPPIGGPIGVGIRQPQQPGHVEHDVAAGFDRGLVEGEHHVGDNRAHLRAELGGAPGTRRVPGQNGRCLGERPLAKGPAAG